MMFFETSATDGTQVEEAFLEMAKAAIKKDAETPLPTTISATQPPGGLKLTKSDHKQRGMTQTRTNCNC